MTFAVLKWTWKNCQSDKKNREIIADSYQPLQFDRIFFPKKSYKHLKKSHEMIAYSNWLLQFDRIFSKTKL